MKDKSRPPFTHSPAVFLFKLHLVRALAFFFLLQCGGQVAGGADASLGDDASDNVPCGDAGACPASSAFCLVTANDGGTSASYACTALPANCHTCDCAKVASTSGTECVCNSSGDEILVSCKPY